MQPIFVMPQDKHEASGVHTIMCWRLSLEQDMARIEIEVRDAL